MITIANTFIFTVITYYTLYRYVVQQNKSFQEVSQIHFQWHTVYLSSTMVVLYTTHSVRNEVVIVMSGNELSENVKKTGQNWKGAEQILYEIGRDCV